MGVLRFNPKTMPLRKSRPLGAGSFCHLRKFCLLSVAIGVAMVVLALYADQEMVRNLNETTQSPLIRRPFNYLTKYSLDSVNVSGDLDVATADFQVLEANQQRTSIRDDGADNKTSGTVKATVHETSTMSTIDQSNETAESLKTFETGTGALNILYDEGSSDEIKLVDQTPQQHDLKVKDAIKPRLFLHVGPQKTGSSTLQSALDIMSELTYRLEEDNLIYRHITPEEGDFDCEIGSWGGFINCVVSDQLKTLMSETRKAGQNLLLTDENLGEGFVGPLRDAISDREWDVTVIVMYRRIHEWLVSWYNQINKTTNLNSEGQILVDDHGNPYREEHKNWPDKGGVYVPEFSSWYKDYIKYWHPAELPSKHRSVEYYQLYDVAFENVLVYNMHQGTDFVTDFFCDILKASRSCQKLREKQVDLSEAEVNASVDLDHDILATFFYAHGFIDKNSRRQDVVAQISAFIADTGKKIPRSCDIDVVDQIFDWLLVSEKIMVGAEWWSDSKEDLERNFKSFVENGKLCDVTWIGAPYSMTNNGELSFSLLAAALPFKVSEVARKFSHNCRRVQCDEI
jgi:hypothetical protein